MSHLNSEREAGPNADGNAVHLNLPPPQQATPPATRAHRNRARRSAGAPRRIAPEQAAEGQSEATGLDSLESNFLDIVDEIRRLVPAFIPTVNNVLMVFLHGRSNFALAESLLEFLLQCARHEVRYPERPSILQARNIEENPLSFVELLNFYLRADEFQQSQQSERVLKTGLRVEEIQQRMTISLFVVAKDTSPEEMEECCICLNEYATGDMLGVLDCGHGIHDHCIRSWLVLENSCPMCKSVALAPLSS